ncbi:hypothetical protein [Paenisporosarcina antarctica]|uniref:Uncharacterized protein n=1 Tax=Paenisporosarcina antarctica TaxID=417367 RepID=A0A4P6ZX50_9BACL|nr:hypothetical protein [Paenisporosarcina antarctica]QBP40972.1 hypothetical protein E2636_07450 [Paenisporosarcina antarctica]
MKELVRLRYFLGIYPDGGNALNNIYDFFNPKKTSLDYLSNFKRISNNSPKNPVILMFDNELKSGKAKPIGKFMTHASILVKKSNLESDYMVGIIDNLYLLTVPLIDGKPECDIEDLFESKTLSHKINGKTFSKNDTYDTSKHYGKEIYSKYILNNYADINFKEFRLVLNNIENIINMYTKGSIDTGDDLETKNIDKSSMRKPTLSSI